ncbi:MAG: hypothetical protein ING89_15345 [Rubrivivax sp.]|nr:hypothetical protein [Rubrivivax sp.]
MSAPGNLSTWAIDPWSHDTSQRLARHLAAGPAALGERAGRLRTAIQAGLLRADASQPSCFVFLACGSYADGICNDLLLQLVDAAPGPVIVVLVLADDAARNMAAQHASRDGLSRLLYFVDGASVSPEAVFGAGPAPGLLMWLRRADPLAVGLLPDLVAQWRRLGCADLRGEVPQPLGNARQQAGPAAGGFVTALADVGQLVSVSHPWLDALVGSFRPEPLVIQPNGPMRRVWFDLASGRALVRATDVEPALHDVFDASRVTCFANHSGPGNDLVFGFALGHGCRIARAEDQPYDDAPGTSLVWGVLRGSDSVVKRAIDNRRPFIYCDHAYFHRGHQKNYRATLNGYSTTQLRRCPPTRTAALGVTLTPWRKDGRHVLVCPPTDYFMAAHGCPNWTINTLSTLRRHTDRPIVVRDKPKPGEPARSLQEDLAHCHALVTHSSNVAVEAAVMGVPVFVAPGCAAVGVGLTDVARIETPAMPDRRPWLDNLAFTQFSFEEVLDGRVLGLLREYWDCPAVEGAT